MKRLSTISIVVLAMVLLLFAAGCGEKKPPEPTKSPSPTESPAQNIYENKEIGYEITIPEGWKTPEGVSVGELYIECENVTFQPKPSFNVVSSKVEKFDVSDPARQKEIKNELEKDLHVASERNTKVAGQPAYQIAYGKEKDDESIMILQTFLFNKEYLIVLTGGCKEDQFNNYLRDFNTILSSLKLM